MGRQHWRWVRRYREGYAYRFTLGGAAYEGYGFTGPKAAHDAAIAHQRRLGVRASHARNDERALSLGEATAEYLQHVGASLAARRDVERSLNAAVAHWGAPRRVNDITARDVADFRQWRLGQRWCAQHGRDCSPPDCVKARVCTHATVNRDLAYLSAFFSWCGDDQRAYVPAGYNPASRRAVPRGKEHPERARHALTDDQKAALWAELPPAQCQQAKLIYYMGIRPGVIFNLDWQRVHWDDRIVSYESKGRFHTHPFNEAAYQILHALWIEAGRPTSGPVFKQRTNTTLRRWWAKARTKLGLPKLRRHDLRITFARDLHDKGAGIGDIQDLMGHATMAMTRQYVGTSLPAQRKALALLDTGDRS